MDTAPFNCTNTFVGDCFLLLSSKIDQLAIVLILVVVALYEIIRSRSSHSTTSSFGSATARHNNSLETSHFTSKNVHVSKKMRFNRKKQFTIDLKLKRPRKNRGGQKGDKHLRRRSLVRRVMNKRRYGVRTAFFK